MAKLICGLSKTIKEPDGGRRSATVNLEVELEASTLRQPDQLQQHIRCGFDRVRSAIEEELARSGSEPVASTAAAELRSNGRRRQSRVLPLTPK